jgi:exopolyphosphatase / guanosine-5'-triphosphate,3'-diphosphate pyrophosphatase
MRVAIVDLGTNTFNLLVADTGGDKIVVVYTGREVVKLGEKSINENRIADAAFARGIKAFTNIADHIKKHKPDVIKVLATSAIREAENGLDFVAEVKKLTGIETTVISGDKEAELIYFGNRLAVELNEEPHLIMDIGGGSTEFIIADNKTVFFKQSYKLGVARLLEKFHPENPIRKDTVKKINDYLNQSLQSLITEIKKHKINSFVGSAGAFETVVDMIGKENSASGKSCYTIDLADYFHISKKTIHSIAEERELMPGLIPMRRDMIVLSYLLIDFVVQQTGISQIKVSTYALKEGALFEIINAKKG